MDTVIELRGLALDGWFKTLTDDPPRGIARDGLSLLRPPAGTFGSSKTKKFKARLQTAAQIAGILSASVALYHVGVADRADACKFIFDDGATTVELVVPCDSAHGPEFVKLIDGTLVKLGGLPSAITVDPVRTPAPVGTRDGGQS